MADPMTPIEVVETYFKAVRSQDLDLLRSKERGGANPHPGPLMQFGDVVAFEVDAHHGDEIHEVADFFTVKNGKVTRLAVYQGPIRSKD